MCQEERSPNLRRLNGAVERAVAEQRRPPTADEGVRAIFPLQAYLDEPGRRAVWRVVTALGEREPDLRNHFVGDQVLADLIVDLVAEHEGDLDWPALRRLLSEHADQDRAWIVGVPVANLMPPRGYVPLGEHAGLGMAVQERDWEPWDGQAPMERRIAFDHLGDYVDAGMRWYRESDPGGRLDTRRTGVLLLVEDGTQTLAYARAVARARYMLALWCLLHAPDHTELWPSLADWEPRPFSLHGIVHKRYEPGKWTGRSREAGRHVTTYNPYELPDDPALLTAPVRVLEAAMERPAARAGASAAWSLHIAERQPGDLQRTDKLLHLQAAIEALCDTGRAVVTTSTGTTQQAAFDTEAAKRWARLTEKLGVWRELRGTYGQRELEVAKRLTRELRNITAHGSDDVLVNLGYPDDRQRHMRDVTYTAQQLAIARVASAVPILTHAVRTTTEHLVREGMANGWDGRWFQSLLT